MEIIEDNPLLFTNLSDDDKKDVVYLIGQDNFDSCFWKYSIDTQCPLAIPSNGNRCWIIRLKYVDSRSRLHTPKIAKVRSNTYSTISSYLTTSCGSGNHDTVWIHRQVALLFVPGDHNLTVDHIDGNIENNNWGNLRWVTNTENLKLFWRGEGSKEKLAKAKQTLVNNNLLFGSKRNHNVESIEYNKERYGKHNKERVHIHKDDIAKFVNKEELESYLNLGWKLGRPKSFVVKEQQFHSRYSFIFEGKEFYSINGLLKYLRSHGFPNLCLYTLTYQLKFDFSKSEKYRCLRGKIQQIDKLVD